MTKSINDFLAVTDLSREELLNLIDHSIRLKQQTKAGVCPNPLTGKAVGLVFHKPSLRTRISFEVGVYELGGHPMFITDKEIQLGVRESISDAARVLSRFLELIVIRTFQQSDLEELAHWSDVPVINALTDMFHPCQIYCDLLTIREKLGVIEDFKIVYLGDGNNVARSWINAAKLLDIDLWIATTEDTHPGVDFLRSAEENARGRITISNDPTEAVQNADVIYTDVWASMGEKDKADAHAKQLQPFQVNSELLAQAKPSCLVMHCLPAERGKEITDEVMESPQSIVFDQAENRLHGQKSIMLWCLDAL